MAYLASPEAVYIFFGILSIIFIIGVIGNTFIIIIYRKREKNSSRIFIMTLAFIDIFTCIVVMPITVPYSMGLFEGVSFLVYTIILDCTVIFIVFLFVSISIDRYLALAKPLFFALSGNRAIYVVLIDIFLTILITLLKHLLTLYAEIYVIPVLFIIFTCFLSATAIMYILAFSALKRREKNKIGIKIEFLTTNKSIENNKSTITSINNQFNSDTHNSMNSNTISNNQTKSGEAKKVAKTLSILTVLFVLSYFPFFLKNFIPKNLREIIAFGYFFNNILNFWVYYASSIKFRNDTKKTLRSIFKR